MRRLSLVLILSVFSLAVLLASPASAGKNPAHAHINKTRNGAAQSTICIIDCGDSVLNKEQFLKSLAANPVGDCCVACLYVCQVDACEATDGSIYMTCGFV